MKKVCLFLFFFARVGFSQSECDGERYISDVFPNINTTSNIQYGENITEDILGFEYTQTLYLDVYEPAGDDLSERPLVIFMFGGAFVGGSRNSPVMVELCTRYAKMGYVAATIDYRLTPTLIWNGTEQNAYKAVIKAIHDLKSAIRFLRMNDELYDDFKIDTSRIYAGGSSAGAISSVNAAYINNESEIPESIFDFVIESGGLEGYSGNPGYNSAFYGVVNLSGAIGHYDWIETGDIPIVSVHGDEDTVVPYADELLTLFGINVQVYGSFIIHQTMTELGNQSALHTFEGEGHTPYAFSGQDMDITIEFTRDFMFDLVCDNSQSGEISVHYDTDWNLVGLPLIVENSNVNDLFPNSIENTLFSFDQGYFLENSLVNGEGYWLRFSEEGITTLSGEILNEISISLDEGWNLISGISEDISIYSAIDPENIIVENTLYEFSEGYFNTDILVPGNGYWLRSFQDGEIILNSDSFRKIITKDYELKHKANSLTINGMELLFGIDIPIEDKIHYSLPPKPPLPSTDIRFSGNTKICESDECMIEVINNDDLKILNFQINDGELWELVSAIGNQEQFDGTISLSGYVQITLVSNSEQFILRKNTNSISPNTFSMSQAYPNPFNPITTIRYDLPEQSLVTLTIYDMLGNEIAQLVKSTQEPGIKSVQWNGTDRVGNPVGAGVYLYRIVAGQNIQTRKMVLLN